MTLHDKEKQTIQNSGYQLCEISESLRCDSDFMLELEISPRAAQEAPKRAQERQEAAKRRQERAKRAPRGAKTRARAISEPCGLDFGPPGEAQNHQNN